MLKELLKNKKFNRIIDKCLKNSDVLDAILFGSIVRGKEEPKDIDILIIFKTLIDREFVYNLRKEFENETFNIHIMPLTYAEMFAPSFLAREGIIFEGYSLKFKKNFCSTFGLASFVLFKYHLNNKTNSEKMRFYYALHGRNKSVGVLNIFNSYKFSDKFIISPANESEKIRDFLNKNEIKYEETPILLPDRLARRAFLEDR